MNNFIIPILFGNSMDSLFGIKNDIYIMYNLLYHFYNKNPNNWGKPSFFINKNCVINNIKEILNINIEKNIIFLIYFSGHSNSKGYLKFYNENINCYNFLNFLNINCKFIFSVYFIIDTCFSENFILNINNNINNNINKIYFLGSSMNNETSKEIETEYDINLFKYRDIKPCNKFIVGIFTLYFVKLLTARNINNIDNFKNIINDRLWRMISIKYNQTIYYNEIIL